MTAEEQHRVWRKIPRILAYFNVHVVCLYPHSRKMLFFLAQKYHSRDTLEFDLQIIVFSIPFLISLSALFLYAPRSGTSMFSKTVICCFLALYTYISLAVATKHDRHHQRASGEIVSIPRNKNAIYVRDGYRARLRVFAKFNWQMLPRDLVPREQDFPFNPAASSMGAPIYQILDPKHNTILHNEETIAAVSKITKQSGSVRTVPEPYHAEYLTPVSIGTPPQVLHMDFDTGSSDFWMFSTLQPDNETSGHDAVFRPGKSSTYKNITGSTWKILYGDGSGATGIAGTDRVKVGGVTVQTQAIELAQGVSDSFVKDTNNDGLAGLGFSNINNGTYRSAGSDSGNSLQAFLTVFLSKTHSTKDYLRQPSTNPHKTHLYRQFARRRHRYIRLWLREQLPHPCWSHFGPHPHQSVSRLLAIPVASLRSRRKRYPPCRHSSNRRYCNACSRGYRHLTPHRRPSCGMELLPHCSRVRLFILLRGVYLSVHGCVAYIWHWYWGTHRNW